jgi:hypothetical protein
MSSRRCHVSELPDDLQVLVFDFVENSLGRAGFEQLDCHRFRVRRIPLKAFPHVRMWTDFRDRAYSEAMIGQVVPPVLVCGNRWLDGRNRVWAARRTGKTTIDCIDLAEIGVHAGSERLARLRWKQRPTPSTNRCTTQGFRMQRKGSVRGFAEFDMTKHLISMSGRSPSLQIRRKTVQQASAKGFFPQMRDNEEIVMAFPNCTRLAGMAAPRNFEEAFATRFCCPRTERTILTPIT